MKKKTKTPKSIRTVLTAESLKKAPLKKFVGKEVEIRLAETDSELDLWNDLVDHDEVARLQAELDGDDKDLSFEEIDRLTSSIPGSWAQDIINDREERF